MSKSNAHNLLFLLISVVCAMALYFLLTHSSPNSLVAVLCAFVTVLCVQIALLRQELDTLKNQLRNGKGS